MDKSHQDTAGSKLGANENENKFWTPPLSTQDQKKLSRLRKKPFAQRMGFANKTLWDFIQLLLISLMLAGVGYWFTAQQNQTGLQVGEQQHQADLQIAADQQRETTLKTCMDDIKDLLLNKSLGTSKREDEIRVVARAEVLSALRRLDGERKALLIQFLSEAGLIASSDNDVIIDLSKADLHDTHLSGAILSGAHLTRANLSRADLSIAYLEHADLSAADLSYATLQSAVLWGADFSFATLSGATLGGADLSRATLRDADLSDADLSDANLSDTDLSEANLSGANLSNADLSGVELYEARLHGARLRGAKLRSALLSKADLSGADLSGADLSGADLSGADLTGATGITLEKLEKGAKSLQGATMPDGSKHP